MERLPNQPVIELKWWTRRENHSHNLERFIEHQSFQNPSISIPTLSTGWNACFRFFSGCFRCSGQFWTCFIEHIFHEVWVTFIEKQFAGECFWYHNGVGLIDDTQWIGHPRRETLDSTVSSNEIQRKREPTPMAASPWVVRVIHDARSTQRNEDVVMVFISEGKAHSSSETGQSAKR